jgi:hypothetical protein
MPAPLATFLFGVALLAGGASAQCQFTSVSTQTYGLGCGQVFSLPPAISAQLDPVACSLGIRVQAFAGCCNTFLRNRILALGIAQANLPLPQIAIGCTLLVNPDVMLWQSNTMGDTFVLPIPPGLTSFTFHGQGAGHYFTTIGLSNDLMLTGGLTMTMF